MLKIVTAYTLSECMDVMGELAAAYEKSGDKNLIFCEDRLTLIAERTLVRCTGGTFDSSVSTFARFLGGGGKVLGKQGSVMAVGKCIAALQREGLMKCFTSPAIIAAQAQSAYETIAQFSASCVDSAAVAESAEKLPNCTLKNKLEDLAKIYERYEDFLQKSGYLDEAKYLSLLPEAIKKEEKIANSNVFFLCFPSFTGLALRAVEEAARRAKNVIGIFCHGDEPFYTGEGYRAFLSACRRIGQVSIEDKGIPLGGEAERLRSVLFNAEYAAKEPYPTDKVHLYAAADRAAEAEYAAIQIKKHLSQKEGLRYRDIAVLLPSTDDYALAIKKAFDDYGIPYFIDEKKTLKNHPLSKFLLSAFACVADNYSPQSVQAFTGNYFFGEADEYRNYLLKHANFRGGAKRALKEGVEDFEMEAVAAGRERLLSLTGCIPKTGGTGRAYCMAVRAILEKIEAEKSLEDLCAGIEDVSVQGYLRQFSPALSAVLAEAEFLTGDSPMKVEAFATMLEEGLDATKISLIPLKMDAVFIGDLCDSRIEKVRVLLALGMTDEVPRAQTDVAFISDKDLARLQEIKTQIDPTIQQVNARAKEAATLNLCTFLEELHLTHPLSIGKTTPAVSEVFDYVRGAFCRKDTTPLFIEKDLSQEDFVYLCSERLPAQRKMLLDKGLYERRRISDATQYSALSEALQKLGLSAPERGEQGLIDSAERLFFAGEAISPTMLESYFDCPYKMLANRGLRLEERQETEMLAVDTGNFVHAVLEQSVGRIKECEDEIGFRVLATQIGEALFSTPQYALDKENASNAYLQKTLLNECAEAAGAVYRQIIGSDFDDIKVEKIIRTTTVKGKVDRVDSNQQYIRIIDYKTGAIDITPTAYYTGQKIQMQLYMDALKGDKTPAAVFYFPTKRDFKKDGVSYKLSGFINGDDEALVCGDTQITAEKKSDYFEAKLGDNKAQHVMSGEDFKDFLAYAPMVAAGARAEIKSGCLSPNPYKGACQYCPYGGMCGYNGERLTPREETGVSVAKILEVVRAESEIAKKDEEGEDNA